LLLIVSGQEEITIDEIGEINDFIQAEAKSDVNIIMGVGEDETLGDAISVTIVATGFDKDQQHEISNTEAKKVIHILEEEQKSSFDLSDDKPMTAGRHTLNAPIKEIPVVEDKVVFDLGEEKEDEFRIIPTTEFIKNIDVVYDEIAIVKEDDFVITDITNVVEEPIEVKEDESQTALTFELPLAEEVKEPVDQVESQIDIAEIEVVEHQEVKATKKIEEDVYFTLEDYTELESNLAKATKPVNKTVDNEAVSELNMTLVSKEEIDVNEQEVVDYKEVSPLDLTIAELQKRAVERREKMKNFNYKFTHKVNNNIDEIEKEPAYKRRGVNLNEASHSSEINASRTTLEIDDNEGIQLRSNNSFLHDNVD